MKIKYERLYFHLYFIKSLYPFFLQNKTFAQYITYMYIVYVYFCVIIELLQSAENNRTLRSTKDANICSCCETPFVFASSI